MLTITIPGFEMYDSVHNEFIAVKTQVLNLEHSLYSISKWEATWKKAFIGNDKKTPQEVRDYIRCMTINKNVDPNVYLNIPSSELEKIKNYIEDPMTATTITEDEEEKAKAKSKNKKITSEEIYWQMTALNIPFECDKWHFNRLQMLIRVCSIKNNPNSKKMSKDQVARSNRALNAARRKASHSKG